MEAAVPSRDISLIRHRHRRQLIIVSLEVRPAAPSVVRLGYSAVAIPLSLDQIAKRRASIDVEI